jgi:DNA-binding transcriptional regulator/RsmH inhibitor MraZ
MPEFCGQETCLLDANGRVKLSPRFLNDFRQYGNEVVLHCLPEGALGVYPRHIWQQMRQNEPRPATRAATSLVFRRQLRRFGAYSQAESISNQGRITVPNEFRELVQLIPGEPATLVGCEIGIEIWNGARWKEESRRLLEHEAQRGDMEMDADLDQLRPGQGR